MCSLASPLILVSKCLGGGGTRRVSIDAGSQTTPSSWKPSQHTHTPFPPRVGQVLRSQNVAPFAAARFYQAIVQAVLLYGSETWVISRTALVRLKGFHIQAAYRMAKEHKPKRGPDHVWEYPRSEDVLRECGMKTMEEEEYIAIREADGRYVHYNPSDPC